LAAGQAVEVVHVRDFGAVADGKTDSGNAIRAAIGAAMTSASGAEVVLEEGSYLVRPEEPARPGGRRGPCFPIHGATNLVVRGAGPETKIVVADPTAGVFQVGLGQEVTLRDFAVDYNPLPFCQGRIRGVDVEAGHFDLEVDTGYPTPDAENFGKANQRHGKWGMIVDPATRRIRSATPDHFMTPRWEHQEGRVWRFFTAQEHYRRGLRHMRLGNAYVHLARGFGSVLFAHACNGVRFENIVIHASPSLAVGLVGNRGRVVVHGVEVRFAPDSTRLLTTNADGVHCQQNRSGPIIEDCYFEGMADDAINIYAPPNVLREVRSPTNWLVSRNCLILPGDRLQVIDPQTGQVRGQVKALSVEQEGRAFLLTLQGPLDGVTAGEDHTSADTLYNLDACGAGFQIRGNHMRGNRRYGCLLRAGGGVVENNVFEDTTGAGVVLTNEPNWPEGPMPWGIVIRDNRFLRGGTCRGYADSPRGAALVVRATRLGHGPGEFESIRDVLVERNEFVDCLGAAVLLSGTRDVALRDNRISADAEAELRRSAAAIVVERSSAVAIFGQEITDTRPGRTAAVSIQANVAPGEDGIRIENLQATLAPGTETVLDRRGGG